MDSVFIFGAKYLFVLSFLIAGVYFLKQPRSLQKKIVIMGIISLPLIYLVLLLVSHLYYDPRPFVVDHFTPLIPHAADNGFPSDHVLLVSAIAALVMYFSRRVGLVLWTITFFVAVSRVYVGVHHLIDVIASMAISLIVASLTYIGMKYARAKTSAK